jgi:eukaryotic-like serine/threonine-protein kinase
MRTRYQNLQEIDGGGQARIFLADDVQENKKVVIKTLRYDNAGTRRRFQREVRLLKEQKDNPFVVRLEGNYLHYSPPFIVLEYCAGSSLAGWVVQRHPVRDVVCAMQHVALGVQGIHAMGGFHRDLTPRNLLVSYDLDGRWRVKLIDFGLGQRGAIQSGTRCA